MWFALPGSFVIPTLGGVSVLVSIEAHAVLAAFACVGTSLGLAWAVRYLQRRSWRSGSHHAHPPLGLGAARPAS